MSATPPLSTGDSNGKVGRVAIANSYVISGTSLGVTPNAPIAVNGSDPAFQQPSSGTVPASMFPGRVVAVGMTPQDVAGGAISTPVDEVIVRTQAIPAASVHTPASPWDGEVFAVTDSHQQIVASGSDLIQVIASAGQNIEAVDNPGLILSAGGATNLECAGQSVRWRWCAALSTWLIDGKSHPGPRTVLVAAGGTVTLTGRAHVLVDTSGGATSVLLPGSPREGLEVTVKDRTGNANTNTLTVTPTGGNHIELHGGGSIGSTGDAIAISWQCVTWRFNVAAGVWFVKSKQL